jgi:hypothetical protein
LQYKAHDVGFRDHVFQAPAGQAQQGPLVAQAAGVLDQLAYRDRCAEVLQLGQILADVVIEAKLAVLREQVDREGGELLRDRGNVERGGNLVRRRAFDISHAVSRAADDLAVLYDGQHRARRGRPIPCREQSVDFLVVHGRGSGLDRGCHQGQDDGGDDSKGRFHWRDQ